MASTTTGFLPSPVATWGEPISHVRRVKEDGEIITVAARCCFFPHQGTALVLLPVQ